MLCLSMTRWCSSFALSFVLGGFRCHVLKDVIFCCVLYRWVHPDLLLLVSCCFVFAVLEISPGLLWIGYCCTTELYLSSHLTMLIVLTWPLCSGRACGYLCWVQCCTASEDFPSHSLIKPLALLAVGHSGRHSEEPLHLPSPALCSFLLSDLKSS